MKPRNSIKTMKCEECPFRTRYHTTMAVHKRMHVRKKCIAAQKTDTSTSPRRSHAIRSDAEIIQVLQDDKEDVKEKEDEALYSYECPKCDNLSCDYFVLAHRHIQALHSVDINGAPVNPNSIDLIKPIRKEICRYCKQIKLPDHLCPTICYKQKRINCFGCHMHFTELDEFYRHIGRHHKQAFMTLFFKTYAEFTKWQREMQDQTQCRYILNMKCQADSVGKQYYQCVHPDAPMHQACPSVIFVEEYERVIQVHFYKDHMGHSNVPYELSDKYSTSNVSRVIRDRNYSTQDTTSLYEDFKSLLTTIICESAKLDILNLKTVYDKALDMTVIVNNFPYVEKEVIGTKVEVDNGGRKGSKGKRKGNKRKGNLEVIGATVELEEVCSPKIVETFTLKEEVHDMVENDSVAYSMKKEMTPLSKYMYDEKVENVTQPTVLKKRPRQYKKIKYLNVPEANKNQKIATEIKVENIDNYSAENGENSNNLYESSHNDCAKCNISNETQKKVSFNTISSFTTFNDTYKDFVENTIGTPIVKKERIRTKLGQFSPKSRHRTDKSRVEVRRSLPGEKRKSKPQPVDRPKVLKKSKDVKYKSKCQSKLGNVLKYEVMEQENDCNILILKL